MKIKTEYKGKEIYIDIPDPKYWEERNKKKVSKYWTNADNMEKRLSKEYLKAYKELEKELYTFIGKYGENGVLKYSQKRIIEIMKKIKPYIDNLYSEQQLSITGYLMDTYEGNYLATTYMIQDSLKVYGSFVGLNKNAIKAAISYPWSGDSFSNRIYQNKDKLITTLKQEITQSIIRGDSIDDLSKTVSKRLEISKKASFRLVQTETGAVMTESDRVAYKDMGMDKYEYLSTLDSRTSEICRDLDGKVFNLEDMQIGVNAPPAHPMCRSTTSPYFDDLSASRIAKRLDTNEYEYIPSGISYREWEKRFK